MLQELRGKKGEPSKKLPGCCVTLGQTSQAPKFPCFSSSLPPRPWCLARSDSGQNYPREDPPALHQLIWLGLHCCTCGTMCELCFPLAAPSPSPSAAALCPCRDGTCHAFGERRVKGGEIFLGIFGLGVLAWISAHSLQNKLFHLSLCHVLRPPFSPSCCCDNEKRGRNF